MVSDGASSGDQAKPDPPERVPPAESTGIEPEKLTSALERLQSGKPEAVAEFMTLIASIGPVSNPLLAKMDGQHITSMLEIVANHDRREFDLRNTDATQRRHDGGWTFAVFVVLVGLSVFVLVSFTDQPDILIPVLSGVGGLVFGGVGGYGFGRRTN